MPLHICEIKDYVTHSPDFRLFPLQNEMGNNHCQIYLETNLYMFFLLLSHYFCDITV